MSRIKLYTTGFTKKSAENFFTKLRRTAIKRVIDIRLNNVSQLAGFAKKHDLIVYFHCCGDLCDVIPDLIEMGVDILDPVQTSAPRMKIENLKREFGKDLCFHGGIDLQQLLAQGTARQVRDEVKRIKGLFTGQGGMLLGPSHLVTRDVPVQNVLAMYN